MTRQRRRREKLDPATEALVTENLRLAHMVAWRWAKRTGVEIDDLEQCSMIGLLKAAKAYKAERGNRFSTLAVPYCQGEILHYLRDRCTGNGLVRLPYRWREAYPKGRRMMDKGLSDAVIADRLGMSLDEWIECRAASTAHNEELQDTHITTDASSDVQDEPMAHSYLAWTTKAFELLSQSHQKMLASWGSAAHQATPEEAITRLSHEFKRVRIGAKPQRQLALFDSASFAGKAPERNPVTRRRRQAPLQPMLFQVEVMLQETSTESNPDDVFRELVARRRRNGLPGRPARKAERRKNRS